MSGQHNLCFKYRNIVADIFANSRNLNATHTPAIRVPPTLPRAEFSEWSILITQV